MRRRFRKVKVRFSAASQRLELEPEAEAGSQTRSERTGAVVSLEVAGRRRLTRDSRNRLLTRDSRIPDFSRKMFGKIRKNRFFGLPGPK